VLSSEAVIARGGAECGTFQEFLAGWVLKRRIQIHRVTSPSFLINDLESLYTANISVWGMPYLRPGGEVSGSNFVEGRLDQAAGGKLEQAVVGENYVGAGATVRRSIIGRRCTLGRGSMVVASVLLDGVVVEDGARLTQCLVGADAVVGSQGRYQQVIVGKKAICDKGKTASKVFLMAGIPHDGSGARGAARVSVEGSPTSGSLRDGQPGEG
jgi:acetyltransferase-like isoleucine patch superfamily enzyme